MARFPETIAATKAYFDVVNASGGIQGRKLVLLTEDDNMDLQRAKEAARKLVETESVVANVGSASILECAANASYYAEMGLVSIQGTGADPECFNSSNISPVNAGPYAGLGTALQFASEVRRREKICVVTNSGLPVVARAYQAVVSEWSTATRKKLQFSDFNFNVGDDPSPLVLKAKRAGCQAMVFTGVEPSVIAWVKAVRAHKIDAIDWIFLTPAYTDDVAKRLGSLGDGIYAMSEFEPWSNPPLGLWRHIMVKGNVPVTSLSEGGYIAAEIFVGVLRTIRGDINRESVTRAFKALQKYETPLAGTPYSFGPGNRHNSNRAAMPLQLRNGRWSVAHPEWIVFPPSSK